MVSPSTPPEGSRRKKAPEVKVDTKRFAQANKISCSEEMNAFLNCLGVNGVTNDEACTREKIALNECAALASKQRASYNSINYHIHRLYRQMKRYRVTK